MKSIEIIATITKVEYKNHSINGNPCYWVCFTANGFERVGRTATDAACGYGCANHVGREVTLTYHETRNGNIIIDFIN